MLQDVEVVLRANEIASILFKLVRIQLKLLVPVRL